jgi:hypothetical protein
MSALLEHSIPGLRPRESLSVAEREEMFDLLTQHFEGVTRAQFEADLAEKNWVVQIEREGRLLGFSTLLVCEAAFAGTPLTAIYSGDTIMAPEAWNSPALARKWIAAVNFLRARSEGRPCYWLLLTSGFRTYRFLPLFWREFHPCFDRPAPEYEQQLLVHLARARYGAAFDAAAGLVRFPRPQKLRGALRAIPPGRERDPHVAFFLTQNPGHAAGDELACLARIDEANLTAAGRRMVL